MDGSANKCLLAQLSKTVLKISLFAQSDVRKQQISCDCIVSQFVTPMRRAENRRNFVCLWAGFCVPARQQSEARSDLRGTKTRRYKQKSRIETNANNEKRERNTHRKRPYNFWSLFSAAAAVVYGGGGSTAPNAGVYGNRASAD